MKPVFEHWPEIAGRIGERQSIFLALDYDGVLTPITAEPDLAVLPPGNRDLLRQLARQPAVRVAIISGRSLHDVRGHVRLPGVIYAGNHGAEIALPGACEAHGGPGHFRAQLVEAREELKERFAGFAGALLEDKGFGIGLHYREVDPLKLPTFHERFAEWSAGLPSDLQILRAKMVYEVRPRLAWNKGNAVRHVWEASAPAALPICLGDDLTDEDGFRALMGQGINIYVGEERQSYAEYILPSQSEVAPFLERLLGEVRELSDQSARLA